MLAQAILAQVRKSWSLLRVGLGPWYPSPFRPKPIGVWSRHRIRSRCYSLSCSQHGCTRLAVWVLCSVVLRASTMQGAIWSLVAVASAPVGCSAELCSGQAPCKIAGIRRSAPPNLGTPLFHGHLVQCMQSGALPKVDCMALPRPLRPGVNVAQRHQALAPW